MSIAGIAPSHGQAAYGRVTTRVSLPRTANGFQHSRLATGSREPVGMALALVFDSSESTEIDEFRAQFKAAARALQDEDVKDRIFDPGGGPGSLAVCVVDYGSTASLRVPWFDIRTRGEADVKFNEIYDAIAGIQRTENGATHIHRMLNQMIAAMDNCPWESRERVIDVFGDGVNTKGSQRLEQARDVFVDRTRTRINAFAILNEAPDLDTYFRKHLVNGLRLYNSGPDVKNGFCIAAAGRPDTGNPANDLQLYEENIQDAFRDKFLSELVDRRPHREFYPVPA